jgi:hypothetical protein
MLKILTRISVSHGGVYAKCCVVGCDTVLSDRNLPNNSCLLLEGGREKTVGRRGTTLLRNVGKLFSVSPQTVCQESVRLVEMNV